MFGSGNGDEQSDEEKYGIDGSMPNEPVGPHLSEATPAGVEVKAGEREGQAHESQYEVTEEIQDEFQVEALATPLAADGLPDHSLDGDGDVGTHPFHIDNQICVEDERQYVELFAEELLERGWKLEGRFYRTPGSLHLIDEPGEPVRSKYDGEGMRRERRAFDPDQVAMRWGHPFATKQVTRPVPVRPRRERCVYYARQRFGNDDQPNPREEGHNIIFRFCTHPARRSIGGAAMSLRNEAIYDCDLREPYGKCDSAWLDAHDKRKFSERPDKVRLPMFGLPGEQVIEEDDEPLYGVGSEQLADGVDDNGADASPEGEGEREDA